MDLRELKGLEIAAKCKLTHQAGVWSVPSQTGSGAYRVTLDPVSCSCEDFQLIGQAGQVCKHVHAARLVWERDFGGKPPAAIVVDEAPKKKTYRQVWSAYNGLPHVLWARG